MYKQKSTRSIIHGSTRGNVHSTRQVNINNNIQTVIFTEMILKILDIIFKLIRGNFLLIQC